MFTNKRFISILIGNVLAASVRLLTFAIWRFIAVFLAIFVAEKRHFVRDHNNTTSQL